MKVEFIARTETKMEECDYRDRIIIKVNGEETFDVRDDEPEDSNLLRSFSDCYRIISLMEKAYNAGKNGEEFEIESIESNDI